LETDASDQNTGAASSEPQGNSFWTEDYRTPFSGERNKAAVSRVTFGVNRKASVTRLSDFHAVVKRNYGANMEQIAIALTGVVAIWLSQDKRERWRKWACIFGLVGQPFWFYSAYTAEQWGIFILCGFYTSAWLKGFRTNWMSAA